MSTETIALLSALGGAIIGALASIGSIWVQQYFQARQARAKIIVEAAMHEYQASMEYAKFMAQNNRGTQIAMNDLGHYVALYSALIQQIGGSGKINKEKWAAAYSEAQELASAADKAARSEAQPGVQADRP